ncbi:MAG: NAD-dependent DNA ligase LigA, partial [Defluviitaleaceae bacterium]|nr:NAD-dependent DNA ligase LigA [Defluviitaleaceae bacterium]
MNRINELVDLLNRANAAYERGEPFMTDFEYDGLYDELLGLEAAEGLVLADSPTQRAGYEIVSGLAKIAHEARLLSLDKTKDSAEMAAFLGEHGGQAGLLFWKLDGLSVVLKYTGGRLVQAVTRGNGEIGEDVTHNAKFFRNTPDGIDFAGELVLRGEAVISFSEFNRINEGLDDEKYKNPRNLCAGTIRQLNSRVAASRNVDFYGFALIRAEGMDFAKKSQQLEFLEELGFECATHIIVDAKSVIAEIEGFKGKIEGADFATDGLVLTYDDIALSASLGATSKFPRDSLAFKWADELAETVLRRIEWHTSRTGLINPIGIFDPVEL